MKKRLIIFIAVAVALLAAIFLFSRNSSPEVAVIGEVSEIDPQNISEKVIEETGGGSLPQEPEKIPENIPAKILINVPFAPQAPFGIWDDYHEEACEEASLIMIKYWLDKKNLTPEIAEKEIQALIKYQIQKYGDFKDSTAQMNVDIARDFYGIKNLKVVYDFKKEDIKKYLALGKPIMIPAAGRLLGNPNFTPPGPLYHNLVLIGYDGNTIITNDPGTRKGKGYRYSLDTVYRAIHDFSGVKEEIEKGRKAMIVIE
ncbi:MAG: C39 family peptidase [Candidatus Moranbacteria bacterium]|nr:C39 family peptidase [Candidatus Moranbacteria bacterium]